MNRMLTRALIALAVFVPARPASADDPRPSYAVGVAKVDITPSYPVRLSGFGFRRTESEGVTQRIWAKALAIDDGEPAVLLTIDTCGVAAAHVRELAARLAKKAGLAPERLAVTVTHTHTAPMLGGVLATLFGQPIPNEHKERIDRYTAELLDNLEKVAIQALAHRKPARLSYGIGRVGFATNRRTSGGPVDHDLPVLVAKDPQGKVLAVYASYACHCVTLSNNKISGDWAGFAQERIEDDYPGAIALVSIGAGADSNPQPRGKGDDVELAGLQGKQVAAEVQRVLATPLTSINGRLAASVRNLELPLATLPSKADWEERSKQPDAGGYHAKVQLERLSRGQALQTKIDYAVQTWAFGKSLAMVFLPGEVVVDYSLRLKRELDPFRLWVNAYSNDVPCYIPSERVLREGGYEGGGAMTYYDLPAPLQAGMEQKIIDAVRTQLGEPFNAPFDSKRIGNSRPLPPQQSLAEIQVRGDLAVELIAAEPLVIDPVAIDWGPDGRLWVAEMHDYPMGVEGRFGPGGRIRVLKDTDSDGVYDEAKTFIDQIPFPTGVTVWRNGVLVCAAPDILYAEDTNGDGSADVVRKLFTGFGVLNYQARVNSLEYGLDGWVHGSCGLFGGTIRGFAGGEPLRLGHRDFRLRPDSGQLEPATGRTQQGRVRDDWGNWFGCDNSNPLWHYPLADHYLRRNPHVAPPPSVVTVPTGAEPNRLFPARDQLQLFKLTGPHGQTTSACGIGVYRDDLLGREFTGNVFTCESVNLVVHRRVLTPSRSTFAGSRAADEQQSEFLASTDNWFRPVQVRTGPDGCLWIVDMYRYVIEHPQWIPAADLLQLDLRAGSTMGRIYRVRPKDKPPREIPRLDKLDGSGLVAALDSPNGWQRDLASQMLIWREDKHVTAELEKLAKTSRPESRLHALCVLDGLRVLRSEVVEFALTDSHPGIRRHAVRLAENFVKDMPALGKKLTEMIDDPDAQVRLQLAYSLGEIPGEGAGTALAKLAREHAFDVHLIGAVVSSLNRQNLGSVAAITLGEGELAGVLADRLVMTAFGIAEPNAVQRVCKEVIRPRNGVYQPWQFAAIASIFDGLDKRPSIRGVLSDADHDRFAAVTKAARETAMNNAASEAERVAAMCALGREAGLRAADIAMLVRFVAPRNPPIFQSAAISALTRIADDDVAKTILAGWTTYSPSAKSQVLELCLSRNGWQWQLLRDIEKKTVPAADIDLGRRQRLLAHPDEQARDMATKLFGGATTADRRRVLEEYRDSLTLAGDATRGKTVYAKACAKCHRMHELGYAVGPDLAGLTNKSPEYLLTEILDPSKNLDNRYAEYFVATKSGQVFTGILATETGGSITLRAPEGKDQVILRDDIDEVRGSGKSLMPEGLERELAPQDMADLIAYVSTSAPRVNDPAALARKILDEGIAAPERQAFIDQNPELAPDLIRAMSERIQPATQEEYRRIPWIWRVAIAAGKRNQTEQIQHILHAALPNAGEPLRDWQAVVIGGGIINGISQTGAWPRDRLASILKANHELTQRWQRALSLAAAMADDDKVPTGTRYDALRMIALDTWERSGERLAKYLGKGLNDELQMGAISGLSDVESPHVSMLLLAGFDHFSAGNRNLAIEALLRTEPRTTGMLDAVERGAVKATQLNDSHKQALRDHSNAAIRTRAHQVLK